MQKVSKPTVYLETTILSYASSRPNKDLIVAGNQQITKQWWKIVLPKCEAVVSFYVIDEIRKGDSEAAKRRLKLTEAFEILKATEQIEKLANLYLKYTGIPERARLDAFHIACATLYQIDFLLTWNCTHIASAVMRKKIESINSDEGIKTPVICTPQELMEI